MIEKLGGTEKFRYPFALPPLSFLSPIDDKQFILYYYMMIEALRKVMVAVLLLCILEAVSARDVPKPVDDFVTHVSNPFFFFTILLYYYAFIICWWA